MKHYCYHCMSELTPNQFCPVCGKANTPDQYPHHLRPGTVLNGKYLVGNCLGEGGFGITYIGRDLTLDIKVAVKEYYPNGYVNRNNAATQMVTATSDYQREIFEHGKERFLMEARSLARFIGEPGIVDVRDYFEANNTAYIIMEYLDGESLSSHIKKYGVMEPDTTFRLALPIVTSLEKIHQQGIVHRDISPDNIMLTNKNQLVLMDFGSARFYSNNEKEMSVMLKQGYAPEEQYRKNGKQGPWTDVYGLCATLYRCITGVVPEDALDRMREDGLRRPSELGVHISQQMETVLMYGLAVYQENRCHDMTELSGLIRDALENRNVYVDQQNIAPPQYSQAADSVYKTQLQNYSDQSYPSWQQGPAQQQAPVYQQPGYQQPAYQQPAAPVTDQPAKQGPSMKAVVAVIVASVVVILGVMAAVVITLMNQNSDNNTKDTSSSSASSISSPDGENSEEEMDSDSSQEEDDESELEMIEMPSFTNKNYETAKKELEKLGLKVKFTYEFNNDVVKDYIADQSPASGTEVYPGATVVLVVSKGSSECPYDYSQKLVVTAPSGSSFGTLTLYEWEDGEFKKTASYNCAVGKNGIGPAKEGTSTTPQGEFDLGVLFVTKAPDSDYTDYYITTKDTCVIDDTSSPDYNQIREGKPAGTHVDTSIGAGLTDGSLNAVIYIEHNGDGFSSDNVEKNKGSAIGLRGKYGDLTETYGDVDISASDMSDLLRRLDSSKNPRIFIGV